MLLHFIHDIHNNCQGGFKLLYVLLFFIQPNLNSSSLLRRQLAPIDAPRGLLIVCLFRLYTRSPL
jgi:hypothetical protein